MTRPRNRSKKRQQSGDATAKVDAAVETIEKRLRETLGAFHRDLDALIGSKLTHLKFLLAGLNDEDPAELRDRLMRSGVFRAWPAGQPGVDDVFWVLFCEDL